MTDKDDPFEERINQINSSIGELAEATSDFINMCPDVNLKGTLNEINKPLMSLVLSCVMSGVEITAALDAINVQLKRIADGLEKDITSQVNDAAEMRAEQMKEEQTKRSYIGQPKNQK